MSLFKVHITFANGVTAASAAFATHKYNKQGAFCFQFDDGSKGMLVADAQWANYSYTDGCGNNRNYKGSVGMNAGTGVPGSNDYNANVYNGPALLDLVAKGHDIENHSYYHTGNTNTPPSNTDLTNDLISVILEDDVINKYTGYWCRGFIIPTNYTGYDTALQTLNATQQNLNKYLSCVSQGETPFYNGQGTAGGTIYEGNIPDPIGNIPNFLRLTRFWVQNDIWTTDNMAQYKSAFDAVVNNTNNIMIIFTHSLLNGSGELAAFTDFFDYLHTHANDNILFASLREVIEYAQMRKVAVAQSLAGNVLTLTIDTDNINHFQRWMDCSFNITSDAAITGVSVEGFSSFSYNAGTKLVNAFAQKTMWGSLNPGPTPDPNQSIYIKHGKFVAQ